MLMDWLYARVRDDIWQLRRDIAGMREEISEESRAIAKERRVRIPFGRAGFNSGIDDAFPDFEHIFDNFGSRAAGGEVKRKSVTSMSNSEREELISILEAALDSLKEARGGGSKGGEG